MAEHIVSGGGNALNAFLKSNTAYTDNDLILVEPGVYSHVLFNKYRKNVVIRSTEGKEKTIIDGEGIYPCFRNNYTNNGYIYTLDGFSLSNGYVSTDVSADNLVPGGYMEAGCRGACRFLNCGFYECSAFTLSADLNGRLGIANTGVTTQYPSYTYFKNCELSGNVSNTNGMFNGIFLNCDVHHNRYYRTHRGDRYAASGTFYACRIYHNEISGIWGGASYADCLIYRNHGNNNWLNERSRCINCTFANNTGILYLDNNFGGRTHYKNCVFYKNFRKDGVTRSSASWGSNLQGTININNYFDQLSTTMIWYTPMTSALVSGDAFLPGVEFGFVDEENDDYHLRPDSILISAGTNYRMSDFEMLTSGDKNSLTALERYIDLFENTDFDGKPFNEEHPSVGAFQFIPERQNIPNKLYPMGKKLDIPSYLTRIEYLESTGTQYVDTGIYSDATTIFSVDAQFTSWNTTSPECFGSYNNRFAFGKINSTETTYKFIVQTRTAISPSISLDTNRHVFVIDAPSGVAKIDTTSKSFLRSITRSSNPLWLFNRSGASAPCNARVFGCKIEQNGVLVRDFVPVRDGQTGYLYDRVSGQLFGNAGTSDFILGPDKTS